MFTSRRGACRAVVLSLAGLMFAGDAAFARIKLITLPVRQRVEIQLDNPNATLVEEERIVPLVKGTNQVDFSWANTQIDPNTIVFRVVAPAGGKKMDVNVLSVSYPPGENALVWQVSSSDSGAARVRISYILGNLTKSFSYRAVSANNEKSLTLKQYMRIRNLANEQFKDSQIWAGWGKTFKKPIGLNETIELLVQKTSDVPVSKTYTCDPSQFGYIDKPKNKLRVPMHYVIKNTKKSGLGTAPLPYGKVRIFIEGKDEQKTTAFLGEDWGRFTPIDDEMKLYLGVAQDIAVVRTIEQNKRIPVAGNLYNQQITIKYEIENFKDQPVVLDVQESIRRVRDQLIGNTRRDVQWQLDAGTNFDGGLDKEKSTFDKAVFHVKLPARAEDGKAEKVVKKFQFTIQNEW